MSISKLGVGNGFVEVVGNLEVALCYFVVVDT
jgi:hypothetical protein